MKKEELVFANRLKTFSIKGFIAPLVLLGSLQLFNSFGAWSQSVVSLDMEKGLVYSKDVLNNQIPDFSYSGYCASEVAIPLVEGEILVPVGAGDATERIQQAIDYVSALPVDESGFRGAVQLEPGKYALHGRLLIQTSGVVLRGAGMGADGTLLVAEGTDRSTLIRIKGDNKSEREFSAAITNTYLPVGESRIVVSDISGFRVGQSVEVVRPSTEAWIADLEMSEFGGPETSYIGWKPGQRDLRWERTIVSIDKEAIVLDVPLTTAIDQQYGGATITVFQNVGRIEHIGVENLLMISDYDAENLKDENHCFNAIDIDFAQNVWVRHIEFRHFAGSAVAVYENGRKVTVEDCVSKTPVSEMGNWRRYTFYTAGQQTLFQRLYSEFGYHDFATGFCAAGPNAFVECEAYLPQHFSGTMDSWASGVLFDIVNIDGGSLSFTNRMLDHQGAGWTAANSVMWQCSASRIYNYAPPGVQNYAIGCWGQFSGNGSWEEQNSHVKPRSLFYAQLAQRLGVALDEFENQLRPVQGFASSSPTLDQAEVLTGEAYLPHLSLEVWIRERIAAAPLHYASAPRILARKLRPYSKDKGHPEAMIFSLSGGYLTANGALITGQRHTIPWWRGVARPYDAHKAQPAVTRFVPGRYGHGYTDDLAEVVAWMKVANVTVLEHNYGLWYERRRDDHQRARRSDTDVWAPFYEQPFARSGAGTAWDGLSKYDLTKYNPFYWSRLSEFANSASVEGKLLFQHHFFQHNILEAGAHWADSPWRPVNNINNTGFPEPVNYAGDKRIFLAEQFYDLQNPVRKTLYRQYIRQCLAAFDEDVPVMHLISAEYTGPLHFVAFWLDVIEEWMAETGRDVWVVLSVTKDVQDAILAQEKYAALVDVVDIRYWANTADGGLYAPEGGKHLAPRQFARISKTGKRSFESVYKSVLPYRLRFPQKAVIYSEGNFNQYGWAVLMAGGSIPVLPEALGADFLKRVVNLFPAPQYNIDGEAFFMLGDGGDALVYTMGGDALKWEVEEEGIYTVICMDPGSGKVVDQNEVLVRGMHLELPATHKELVVWAYRKE
jgi:hypothetical protein